MINNTSNNSSKSAYLIGWALGACGLLLAYVFSKVSIYDYIPYIPCMLRTLTGYYCPGCGGTRAVEQLLQGHLLSCFLYHPVVFYCAILYVWYMVSQTIERLSKNRMKIGMQLRVTYIWIALAILIINFVVKNVLLYFGMDVLTMLGA